MRLTLPMVMTMRQNSGWHKGSRMLRWGELVCCPLGGNPWKNVRIHGLLRPLRKGKINPNGCSLSCRRHKTSLFHLDGLLNSLTIALYSLLFSLWPPLARSQLWRATWGRWGLLLGHNIICCPRLVEFTGLLLSRLGGFFNRFRFLRVL